MYKIDVKHTLVEIETLSCALSLVRIKVELTDTEVTQVDLSITTRKGMCSVSLAGKMELEQLHTVIGNILQHISSIQEEGE